jgi:hypothetical protein
MEGAEDEMDWMSLKLETRGSLGTEGWPAVGREVRGGSVRDEPGALGRRSAAAIGSVVGAVGLGGARSGR